MAEEDGVDHATLRSQCTELPARCQVPAESQAIQACGHQLSPIRAERHRGGIPCVSLEHIGRSLQIPDLNGTIVARRDQPATILIESEGEDTTRVSYESPLPLARWDVTHGDCSGQVRVVQVASH